MVPYIILFALPTIPLICFNSISKTHANKRAFFLFFAFLVFMLSLKADSIGNDTYGYIYKFRYYSSIDVSDILFEREPLYGLLNKLVSLFSNDYHWLFFLCALLSLVPVYCLYKEYSEFPYLSISLFITLSNFVVLFSGLRQSIAVGIGIVAFYFLKKKKFLFFFLAVIVAFLFHNSSFMLLFMLPLYYLKLNKKSLFFLVPTIIMIGIFNRQIFLFLAQFVETYKVNMRSTGAWMMLLLFVIFGVFCYVIPDEESFSQDEIAMRNFLLFSIVIQLFASINTLAMRLGYYYMIFIPCIMARTMKKSSVQQRSSVIIAHAVMIIFFFAYFFANRNRDNSLNTYPFVFFWGDKY